jgi:hypothetical protein
VSARQAILSEIETLPDEVLQKVIHYIRVVARQQQVEEDWSDVQPSREVEQEILDILDAK